MKKTIGILLICYCGIAYSQTTIDNALNYHQFALQEHEVGNDSLAFIYANKSLTILETLGDTLSEQYAEYLHDVGMFSIMGNNDFDIFSNYMQRSLSLKKKLYGTSDDYYWSLQCFGDGLLYYSFKTSFPHNISILEWAVEIYDQIPLHDTIENYMVALNNLADAYEDVDLEKSIAYIQQVLSIKRLYFPESDTLVTLSNLGEYYKEIGKYQESLSILLNVLYIHENQDNSDTNKLIQSNMRLASLYNRMRDGGKAYYYSEKARNLEKTQNGIESQLYATLSMNSALYLFMTGDVLNGLKMLKETYSYPQSDKVEIAFNIASIYSYMNNSDSCYYYLSKAWNISKEEITSNIKTLSAENRYKYFTTERVYKVITSPIVYFLQHKEHNELKRLAYNSILFYKKLSHEITKVDDSTIMNEITTETIKKYLRKDEIAIDLWSDVTNEISNNILAFIVSPQEEEPIFVELPKDSIYMALRNEIETSRTFLPLYETMWKKIFDRTNLKRNGRIFISCDDIYTQIPIESICNYDFEYIGDLYTIIRVSHSGNIPNIKKGFAIKDVALYGGLKYECSSLEEELVNITELTDNDADTLLVNARDNLRYLIWSKKEIDSINTILKSTKGIKQIQMFSGFEGTEDSFKGFSGNSPSIIHIATHGRFIQANEEMSWYEYYRYCLDNAGIWMSCSSDEERFLSAEEIRHLDLSKTSILILSACNTGKGGVTPYGIIGLQNAFKQAGVGSIIMTLNIVNDAATCFFMTSFYSALNSGMNPREAFKNAQYAIRTNEYFKEFNYWAYFVMLD